MLIFSSILRDIDFTIVFITLPQIISLNSRRHFSSFIIPDERFSRLRVYRSSASHLKHALLDLLLSHIQGYLRYFNTYFYAPAIGRFTSISPLPAAT